VVPVPNLSEHSEWVFAGIGLALIAAVAHSSQGGR
jgi:hypothetical protein